MTQPLARREREKAEQAERIERGINAFEAARERIRRDQAESANDGAAARGADAPTAYRAPTRAAPPGPATRPQAAREGATITAPSHTDPAEYVLTFGKYRGSTLGEIAGLDELEGADYLEWLRARLRETLAALELYLTSQAFLNSDEDEDDGEPDDFRKHHLGYDHHAPACVKKRYQGGNA